MALRSHLRRAVAPPPLESDCALFLDIDGTLLELAPAPNSVHVDPSLATLLSSVRRKLGGALALITGRSISGADKLFPGMRLPLAGQHGCERRDAQGTLHLHAPASATLEKLRKLFTDFARAHDGLVLEDKGATFAVHYRAAPHLASHVHRTLRDTIVAVGATEYRLQRGKQLLELRPDGRDKGTAIRDFMTERPFKDRRPVFVGDDRADEHGFAVVEAMKGWSIKVGRGSTRARYRLRDVAAVLQWMAASVESGEAPQTVYRALRSA